MNENLKIALNEAENLINLSSEEFFNLEVVIDELRNGFYDGCDLIELEDKLGNALEAGATRSPKEIEIVHILFRCVTAKMKNDYTILEEYKYDKFGEQKE